MGVDFDAAAMMLRVIASVRERSARVPGPIRM